jgi:tetratricopeptide (TPR) repeat protein
MERLVWYNQNYNSPRSTSNLFCNSYTQSSLALTPMKSGFYILIMIFIFGCSNNDVEETNSVLKGEPYAIYTDSILLQPANAELYYRRGSLLLQNNQLVYAEKDFKKAWNIKPDEQYALSIVNVLRRRNIDSAIAFIDDALKQLPGSIALRIGQARGYQQKANFDKALIICDEVIAEYPGQLDALQLKAELLQAQNKNEEAIRTLEKAYTYGPGDAELAHSLAFAYAEAKNIKAIALSDSLITADTEGKHAEPYYFKGVYYANIGNRTGALVFFNQAILHDYYFLDAYMEKGYLFYHAKNYKEALETFELAAKVSPTFAEAYYWQGKTNEAMGNKEDAKLNYQQAFGLDKTFKEAKDAADRLSNDR